LISSNLSILQNYQSLFFNKFYSYTPVSLSFTTMDKPVNNQSADKASFNLPYYQAARECNDCKTRLPERCEKHRTSGIPKSIIQEGHSSEQCLLPSFIDGTSWEDFWPHHKSISSSILPPTRTPTIMADNKNAVDPMIGYLEKHDGKKFDTKGVPTCTDSGALPYLGTENRFSESISVNEFTKIIKDIDSDLVEPDSINRRSETNRSCVPIDGDNLVSSRGLDETRLNHPRPQNCKTARRGNLKYSSMIEAVIPNKPSKEEEVQHNTNMNKYSATLISDPQKNLSLRTLQRQNYQKNELLSLDSDSLGPEKISTSEPRVRFGHTTIHRIPLRKSRIQRKISHIKSSLSLPAKHDSISKQSSSKPMSKQTDPEIKLAALSTKENDQTQNDPHAQVDVTKIEKRLPMRADRQIGGKRLGEKIPRTWCV
ncbi:hypothetical protein EDC01DRAFT_748097, partial [Geopyxis carbonaria]